MAMRKKLNFIVADVTSLDVFIGSYIPARSQKSTENSQEESVLKITGSSNDIRVSSFVFSRLPFIN